MARNKEYVRDDVLQKAVAVFWTQGYKATSVKDIVAATGLNTASMYKEFGDKDGVFENALDYYRRNILEPRFRLLRDARGLQGISAFLDSVVAGAMNEGYRGCLMMNHLAQKHSISARAAAMIGELITDLETLLAMAFRTAQVNGELPADKDPVALASFVMCSVHGLVLYGRHPHRKQQLPRIRDLILHAVAD